MKGDLNMNNIDFKSLCIGFLGACLFFTLTGAKQKKNPHESIGQVTAAIVPCGLNSTKRP